MTITLSDLTTVDVLAANYRGEPYPRLRIRRDSGRTSVTTEFDLEARSQVDALVEALRPYSTMGPDPDVERKQVRALLFKAVGAILPTSETNAELANRCRSIIENTRKHEAHANERADRQARTNADNQQRLAGLDRMLQASTLPRGLSLEDALRTLLADRARADAALAGRA